MKANVVLVLILVLFASCTGKQEKTQPTVENISESVYASGVVKSLNQYQLFPTVSGIVQQVLVTEGDEVKQGDALLTVESKTARLNAENARIAADYARMSANTEKLHELQATIDLALSRKKNDSLLLVRQRNLWAQKIGSRVELEHRELAYQSALTTYRSTLLRYHDLKKQLEFAERQSEKNLLISQLIADEFTIRSETRGKVYSILKEKGELVSPQTPVAIIGDANTFVLELQVDEYDIARIRIDQRVLLKMDSYKGQVFEARVDKINPAMNERSRSFLVEANFVSAPPVLYPNLTTEANIIIRTKTNALTIPREYLVDNNHVMNEDKKPIQVVTGLKDYQKVEILEGLQAHEVLLKPNR